MKKTLLLFLLLGTISVFSQEKFTLSGTVSETETGETLIGVSVIILELQSGAITNEYGFYSITLIVVWDLSQKKKWFRFHKTH